jgi:hypothetical protein
MEEPPNIVETLCTAVIWLAALAALAWVLSWVVSWLPWPAWVR